MNSFSKVIESTQRVYDSEKEEEHKTDVNWKLKSFIRSSEAKVALNFLGLKSSRAYTLNLPFYGTNHFNRKSPGENDYDAIRSLLRLI